MCLEAEVEADSILSPSVSVDVDTKRSLNPICNLIPGTISDCDCGRADCNVAFVLLLWCVVVWCVVCTRSLCTLMCWTAGWSTDQPINLRTGWTDLDLDLDLDLRTVFVSVCVGTVYVMGVGVYLRLCGVVIVGKYVFWCWS